MCPLAGPRGRACGLKTGGHPVVSTRSPHPRALESLLEGPFGQICAPGVCTVAGRGEPLGTLAAALGGWAWLTRSFPPDSGRLPKASLVSIALGIVLVVGLAGLTWTLVCRW